MNSLHLPLFATPALAENIARTTSRALDRIAEGGGTLSYPEPQVSLISGRELMTCTAAAPSISPDGSTLILPMHGTISKRMDPLMAMMGMPQTSSDMVERAAKIAENIPSVQTVVLDMDSDGGTVEGLESARRAVKSLASKKLVLAVANERMNSAAYYLGSAATAVLATPTSTIGSIGVMMVLTDETERNAKEGIRYEVIRTGEFKALGTPMEQITDKTVKHFEERANRAHTMFVNAVADNRQIEQDLANKMADGKTYLGSDAVEAGLADGEITSLQELMSMLLAKMAEDEEKTDDTEEEDTEESAEDGAEEAPDDTDDENMKDDMDDKEPKASASRVVSQLTAKLRSIEARLDAAEKGNKRASAEALIDNAIKEDRIAPAMRSKHIKAAMSVGVDSYADILGSMGARGTVLATEASTKTPNKTAANVVTLKFAGGTQTKDFDLSDDATVQTLKNSTRLKAMVRKAAIEQDVTLPVELN